MTESMSEFITIQVGQCGNQIGHSFWPLVLDEYGIKSIPNSINRELGANSNYEINEAFHSFFSVPDNIKSETIKTYSDITANKIKARAILIDMEDSVLSKYRSGKLQDMFCNKLMVSNYPGSGNNWAEGYLEHGSRYKDQILNIVQRSAEKCDSLHGFIMLFSLGGGTGSGLGTATLKMLEDYFPMTDRFVCCVYPSGTEDVITSPYNVALATEQLIKHASCVFPVENRALSTIVNAQKLTRSTDTDNYLHQCKPFEDMNSIIVNMLLHLTSGCRFSGSLNTDMSDLLTNMVPFPNVQYLTSSYSPLSLSTSKTNIISRHSQDQLFCGVTSINSQLVKVDPLGQGSLILGATLEGRGNLSLTDMRRYVTKLQAKAHFTPWSKTAVKVGLCSVPPRGHNQSLLGLFNTTGMSGLFQNVLNQFSQLYKRKAHVHHYKQVRGFERGHFESCRETLQCCIDRYAEIVKYNPNVRPRLEVT